MTLSWLLSIDWFARLAHGSPGNGSHLLAQHRISTGQGQPYSIQQQSRNLFTSKSLERGVAARLIFKLRIIIMLSPMEPTLVSDRPTYQVRRSSHSWSTWNNTLPAPSGPVPGSVTASAPTRCQDMHFGSCARSSRSSLKYRLRLEYARPTHVHNQSPSTVWHPPYQKQFRPLQQRHRPLPQ